MKKQRNNLNRKLESRIQSGIFGIEIELHDQDWRQKAWGKRDKSLGRKVDEARAESWEIVSQAKLCVPGPHPVAWPAFLSRNPCLLEPAFDHWLLALASLGFWIFVYLTSHRSWGWIFSPWGSSVTPGFRRRQLRRSRQKTAGRNWAK